MKKLNLKNVFFTCILCCLLLIPVFANSTDATQSQIQQQSNTVTYHYLRNMLSGLYLDVSGGVASSGTNVQIYTGNKTASQKWKFELLSNGYYVIRSALSDNLALSVQSNYTSDWSNICIRSIGTSNTNVPDYALWKVTDNGDCTLRISSKCSGDTKYLDCSNGGSTSGTNVIQYTYNGDMNTRWMIERDDESEKHIGIMGTCIDGNGHMDWEGDTRYDTEFRAAIDVWNAHKPGMIREDTVWIYQDVAVKDYTNGDNQINAGWTVMVYNGTTNREGTIYLNTYFMDEYDYDERKSVALHELGHALGLGESSYSYNCMFHSYSRNITLSFADRRSLDEVYDAKVNG